LLFFGSQFGSGGLFYVRCAAVISGAESGGSFFGGLKTGNRVMRGSDHTGEELRYFLRVSLRWETILCSLHGSWFGNEVGLVRFFWKSIRERKVILCSLRGGGFGTGVNGHPGPVGQTSIYGL